MIANVLIAGQACRAISDLCVRCGHGPIECVRQSGRTFCGDFVERGPRRRSNHSGACAHGHGRALPNLLATHLRLPAPQRPLEARRRRFNATIFQAPVARRDTPARFAREGTLPKFPPRRAEALPGGRTRGAAHFETRRGNAIHFDG